MTGFSAEMGRTLRTLRLKRGLRLDELRLVSGGRFSPTTVAGYERAERSISLRRFCELCQVYEVRPERVLAQVLHVCGGGQPVEIDLAKLGRLDGEEQVVGSFLRNVAARRGDTAGDVVTIRAGDLDVLATAANLTVDELLCEIGAGPDGERAQTPFK
jgi:transcriptional regulator with XRE-family HTH domain